MMSFFRRFLQTVDGAVSRLENSDAVITARLRQSQAHAATARSHLQQLIGERDEQRGRIELCDQKITEWTRKAREAAATDETTALHCVRFINRYRTDRATACAALSDRLDRIAELEPLLHQMQDALHQLQTQHDSIRTDASLQAARAAIEGLNALSPEHDSRAFEPETTTTHQISTSPRRGNTSEADALRAQLNEILQGDNHDHA